MSILMDALRKAEEAKKKAELASKSTPAAANSSTDADSGSIENEPDIGNPLDIEIELAEPQSSAPQSSTPPIEDLATQAEYGLVEKSEEVAEFASPASPSARPIPDYSRPATPPVILQTTRPDPDSYSIDFEPLNKAETSPGMAASKSVPAFSPATSTATSQKFSTGKSTTQSPSTQNARVEQSRGTDSEQLDTSLEEQDRRSAQSVFAAKRRVSPLQKNLQLSALSIAAVLIVAIGTYFYINLRANSGFSIPVTDQVQRELTEAELSMSDAEIAASNTEPSIATPEQTAQSASSSGSISQTVDVLDNSPTSPLTPAPTPATAGNIAANTRVNAAPQSAEPLPAAPTAIPESRPGTPVSQPAVSSNADNFAVTDNGNSRSAATAPSGSAPLSSQTLAPEALVSFTRSTVSPSSNPQIDSAYAAYQAGNLESAEQLYSEALAIAPLNRNALLGLAAIAASRNDTVAALELYSRLLARDPSDPVVQAGLLEIMPRGSLQQQEVELRRLQNQNPDIAPLAYAVGNFMASQQRWPEAQQAYFSALQLAKNSAQGAAVNPDYAFNLAVSLEHLGQPRSAVNYYSEALTLAETHPAGFNLALARQRLSSIGSGNE